MSPGSRRILILAALVPAIVLAVLIAMYAVNVPFADEWDVMPLFQLLQDGKLTFHYLIAQHNEHRIAIPRLLAIPLMWLSGGDVRAGMAFTFFLACVISACVAALLRRSLPDRSSWPLWWLLANVLIFSPVQHENWLMGMQMLPVLPVTCLAVALVVAGSKLHEAIRWILCAALCLIASFSLTNGLVSWLILAPLLLVNSGGRRWWWLAAWLLLMAGTFALYFHGYSRPPHHPSFLLTLSMPFTTFAYFLALLGTSICRGPGVDLAIAVGAVILALGLVLVSYLARYWRDRDLLARSLSWLILCAYAIASSAMTAIGRASFGVKQAQDSRYTTVSVYLVLALLALAPIIWQHAAGRLSHRVQLTLGRVLAGLAIAALVLQAITFYRGIGSMQSTELRRLRGQAGIALLDFANVDEPLLMLYPQKHYIEGHIRYLDQLGVLHPGIRKPSEIPLPAEVDPTAGKLRVFQGREGTWLAEGWACGPGGRAADAVILATASAGQITPLLVASTRPDQKTPGAPSRDHSFSVELPAGVAYDQIAAWSYDVRTNTTRRLPAGER